MNVTLENNRIFHEGKEVGILEYNTNTLVNIEVKKQHLRKGIATEALKIMLERMQHNGHEKVKTTTVVSVEMENLLREKLDFSPVIVEEVIGKTEDGEPLTREKKQWEYEF